MTIRDFMVGRGYMRSPTANAGCCPFHGDNSPSAMVNDDTASIFCFSCQKNYGPREFKVHFGVDIDTNGILRKPDPEYEWKHPLFYF